MGWVLLACGGNDVCVIRLLLCERRSSGRVPSSIDIFELRWRLHRSVSINFVPLFLSLSLCHSATTPHSDVLPYICPVVACKRACVAGVGGHTRERAQVGFVQQAHVALHCTTPHHTRSSPSLSRLVPLSPLPRIWLTALAHLAGCASYLGCGHVPASG